VPSSSANFDHIAALSLADTARLLSGRDPGKGDISNKREKIE
jgi:hypothetical protein